MATFDPEELSHNLAIINETFIHLEKTILAGWPHEIRTHAPTEDQVKAIVATYHELSLHDPTMDIPELERWYLAGQIIARIERDSKESL
jgi:hypothetical protein